MYFAKEASPQLTKMNDMDILMDDSLDGGPPSVGSGDIPAVVSAPGTTLATPVTSKKVRILPKMGHFYYPIFAEIQQE